MLQIRRTFKKAGEEEYKKLIQTLTNNGMVELRGEKPKVINGIFGVPKKGKQCLIIDARNANNHFIEPDDPKLPNPGIFPLLMARNSLFFAKSDMDNFYHRLRLPRWITTYFGLPPVNTEEGTKWHVVMTVPMGWSHSVVIIQAIHGEVLRRCGISEEQSNQNGIEIGEYHYGAYIDDDFSIGTDISLARSQLAKVVAKCEELGVPAKEGKVEGPENSKVTILGFDFNRDGVVRLDPEKLKDLLSFTKWYSNEVLEEKDTTATTRKVGMDSPVKKMHFQCDGEGLHSGGKCEGRRWND